MFCSNCGKEVPDNAKFCPHCGNPTEIPIFQPNYKNPESASQIKNDIHITGLLTVIVLFMISVMFVFTMCNYFESNMDAFDWIDEVIRAAGILIYILLPTGVVIDCAKTLYKLKTKTLSYEHILGVGCGLCITAVILKVFSAIFNDWSSNSDFSIVMYRILGTYEGLWGWTLFGGVIIIVLWILTSKNSNA